jgi:hypothetical protein
MVFTLVLLGIGALLFLVIAYNMVQQFKQKQETERRLAIAKQKAIINETEELLLHSSILPYSKELVELLHKRMLEALNQIRTTDPSVKGLNNRIRATKGQLSQIKNAGDISDSAFRAPDTDKDALQMLQIIKKIRAVVRSEHAKGRLNTQVFVLEDRRLELMQLKVNIENALKRAVEAQALRQWGTARQLLNKGISALSNISDRDAYLEQKLQDMRRMNQEMSDKLKSASKQEAEDLAEKETDELDVLFQPKKKW